MALSDSRRKANDKYIKANYSRVALSMPKAEAEALEEYCKRHNISKAGFIRDLIKAAISAEREGVTPTTGVLCQPESGGVTSPSTREE